MPRTFRREDGVRNTLLAVATVVMMLATPRSATPQERLPGTEEFGLSERELVEKIESVEALMAKCMREHGFQYIAADYKTVRKGMAADKTLPGLSEKGFIARHGYGISTFYTGKPPQLADGYNPGKIGLGEQNVRIYKNLSPADKVAYNRALLGEDTNPTFAVALEIENFSRTGGCTRTAIAQASPHLSVARSAWCRAPIRHCVLHTWNRLKRFETERYIFFRLRARMT